MRTSDSFACLLLVLVASCGGDDDAGPHYETSCDVACSHAYECDSDVDEAACAEQCKADAADIGPQLSTAFLDELDACVAELTCPELVVASFLPTCQRDAAARLALTPAAEMLCDAVVESIRQCTGLTVGTSGCLDSVKIFRDSALRAGMRCEEEPCDQRAACLRQELGIDPTEM